jgi:hypothetical protein
MMETLRTFVCPGKRDPKTNEVRQQHGGWWNTKTSDKCPRCGQDALRRADEDVSIRHHFEKTTMSEHEERS